MTSARTRGRMVERLRTQGIKDESVLAVMGALPRHVFVDEALAHRAYDDVALPIGHGQTISQPYIVARMSELAVSALRRERVLEIGTGCGYQSAVLGKLFKTVFSVERIALLLDKARSTLRELQVNNVRLRHADGHLGLPESGPFDVVIMTAAASHLPLSLLEQLAPGGRLIFPLGTTDQELRVIERTPDGFVEVRLEKVRFVPLLPGLA
ncbi:protein-L-isoaspartate(D-aspartate) O-methyltransferase [Chitinimonas sp. DQS-5]|uniref:Protein-L-isoaspartate O-methyltransferase n=2 Tax=Parachitinimonas caeni TaxID=3031301 RepID=A0ABT7DXE2_9NEIS|nr:protein-L-isoaspartate(D-aspartate) O-methyltransferase [Parachitinimonas caeni]